VPGSQQLGNFKAFYMPNAAVAAPTGDGMAELGFQPPPIDPTWACDTATHTNAHDVRIAPARMTHPFQVTARIAGTRRN